MDAHLPSTVINHKKLRMWAISALEGSIHEEMLIDTLTDIMNRLYSQLETFVPKRHVERVSMYQTMCEAEPLKRQLNAYVASTQEQTVFSICPIFYWKSRFKKYMWYIVCIKNQNNEIRIMILAVLNLGLKICTLRSLRSSDSNWTYFYSKPRGCRWSADELPGRYRSPVAPGSQELRKITLSSLIV